MIDDWVNPMYLEHDQVHNIRESALAKPLANYAVIDNFFRLKMLDQLIDKHQHLQFSEINDKVAPDGAELPYDSAVVFANKSNFGADLFFDSEWARYCCYLVGASIPEPIGTEVKLRYHRPFADGFWIHTDSTIRDVVVICYFNKEWHVDDGGLLQLWRVDEELSPLALRVEKPIGRLDILKARRINTKTPGGGFPDGLAHDLVLVDQIVPVYNRIFVCNFQGDPVYHSVTPSNGVARCGFVQWFYNAEARDGQKVSKV